MGSPGLVGVRCRCASGAVRHVAGRDTCMVVFMASTGIRKMRKPAAEADATMVLMPTGSFDVLRTGGRQQGAQCRRSTPTGTDRPVLGLVGLYSMLGWGVPHAATKGDFGGGVETSTHFKLATRSAALRGTRCPRRLIGWHG